MASSGGRPVVSDGIAGANNEARPIEDDIRGTLPGDAEPPLLVEGACGTGADVELVAAELGTRQDLQFAPVAVESARDALYFVDRVDGGPTSRVSRISKNDCSLELLYDDSDLHAVAVTATHLLWRPRAEALDSAFRWEPLDGSAGQRLEFAGGRPIGATATHVYLRDGARIDVVRGNQREPLVRGVPCAQEERVFGTQALFFSRPTVFLTPPRSCASWVNLETGEVHYLGEAPPPAAHSRWESAYLDDDTLYYCDGGVVRATRSGSVDTRFIDGPCERVVHVDATGVYWATPGGVAHAARDGAGPRLLTAGRAALVDEAHVYFFDGSALKRTSRFTR